MPLVYNPVNAKCLNRQLAGGKTTSPVSPPSKYQFRAYSDGRYLDTDLNTSKGFRMGLSGQSMTVKYTMGLNDKGEWVDTGGTSFSGCRPRKKLEMLVRKAN